MSKTVWFHSARLFPAFAALLFLVACAGCRHAVSDPVLIHRVAFYNHTGDSLEDIALVNPQNARLASCSHLVSGAFFDVGFSARPYTEDSPAVLRWKHKGLSHSQMMPPFRFASGVSSSDAPAAVVITFRPDGTIDSALK